MSSIQNNPTPAQVAAQNSSAESMIKSTQASIQTLGATVQSATAQVSNLSSKVNADYQALAANPSDKTLQKTLAADVAALNSANSSLSDASKQLQDLLNNLPTLMAQAKAKDQGTQSLQQTSDKEAQVQKDAQSAKATLENANAVLTAGQAAASNGASKLSSAQSTGSDAYNAAGSNSSPSSNDELEQKLGTSTGGALGASNTTASGSTIDAKSILAQNGIPSSPAYLKDPANERRLRAQFGDSLFDNMLSALSGPDGEKKDNSGKATGAKKSVGGALGAGKTAAGGIGGGLGASNTATTATNSIGADGGITANASGGSAAGGALGDAADTSAVNNDPQAAVNPSALSANEIMMLVMLESTDELNKEMQGMAQQLQKATQFKSTLRGQLNNLNGQIVYNVSMTAPQTQKNAQVKAMSQNVQNELDSIGDDTQMMQLRLQNLMQMQQQFVQAVSNISKNLNDTSMAILRHIGS